MWLVDSLMLFFALCCCSECLIEGSLSGSALLLVMLVTKRLPVYLLARLKPPPLIEDEMLSIDGWAISAWVFFTEA